ncbi:hypothetical protein BGZ81_005343, partial [Podila clonocystis]
GLVPVSGGFHHLQKTAAKEHVERDVNDDTTDIDSDSVREAQRDVMDLAKDLCTALNGLNSNTGNRVKLGDASFLEECGAANIDAGTTVEEGARWATMYGQRKVVRGIFGDMSLSEECMELSRFDAQSRMLIQQ